MQIHVDTVPVCGLNVASEDKNACLYALLCAAPGDALTVFTPNAEMLAAARHNGALRSLLRCGDLLLPDGIGACILSRFRIRRRIPGIEMGEALLSAAARRGDRVYLLGGKPGVARRAAVRLKRCRPHLNIAGTHHGYFAEGGREERELLQEIIRARPALLIVCLGFPRQERFLCHVKKAIPTLRVGIALGGALDVFSEDVRRAPLLFRKCGAEWLWRIACEPKRARRLFRRLCGKEPLTEATSAAPRGTSG